MNSFFQFVIRKSFKTLPDGKCVFINDEFFKSTYLIIPNTASESILKNKIFWFNTISWTLAIGGVFIVGYYTETNIYIVYGFIFTWQILSWMVRRLIVRKDVSYFQRISSKPESFFFYDNFTNKVEVGKNKIPLGYKISKYLEVPDNDDKILLLQYEDLPPIVLRCALGGWIIWRAQIDLDYNDILSNMEWRNGEILLSNSSVSSILLDANTGSIVKGK